MEHRKIRRNRLQCKLCGDIIESKYTHDYVMCSCKKCAIDGGKEYVRFSAPKPDDVIFMHLRHTINNRSPDQSNRFLNSFSLNFYSET